ncbi:aspartic peptidase domain-containing protein [Xylariales sp. AK1849]|nr:aspartic peptidase domain-containing protein [Xylariales sp. AK1849]
MALIDLLKRLLFLDSAGIFAEAQVEALASRADLRFASFPIQSDMLSPPLAKRDQDIQLSGNRSSESYFLQLYIGTPEQPVKVIIDTGSDELWVNPNCSSSGDAQQCNSYGFYDPRKSSTMNNTQATTNVSYADGSQVDLTYYTDTITLSTGLQVPGAKFGLGTASTGLTSGILGLGFGESTANTDYQNFIDQLASQQITNSKAFSLALGNQTTSSGGIIIFGGVDTKKFSGQLVPNDILPNQNGESISRYWIQTTSIGLITSDGKSTNYSGSDLAMVLDTGTTLTLLPTALVNAMAHDFQATMDEKVGAYVLSCSQLQNGSFVNFSFGSVAIAVPISDFIYQSGQTCLMGAQPSDEISILGLNFLRSAYVVFDQTLNTISLAQYVDCGQNEQVMPSSGAAGFVGECVVRANTSTTTPTNSPTASPTASSSPAQTGDNPSGLSAGAKAGIGTGVGVAGVIAIAAALYFFVFRTRRKASNDNEPPPASHPELESTGYYNPSNQAPQELGYESGYNAGHASPQAGAYGTPMVEVPASPQHAEMGGQHWQQAKDRPASPVELGADTHAPHYSELGDVRK